MRRSSPIAEYLDALTREMSFDRALAHRVRTEVEDHLWQAATEGPGGPSPETQWRAIVKFGGPRELARQYVATSLLEQMRRVATVLLLSLTGIFVVMKGRTAWYGFVQWEPDQNLQALSAVGVPIDRYAYLLAFTAALVSCGYIATRRVPSVSSVACSKELNCCLVLCGIATSALLLSVTTETVLTAFRLFGTALCADALVPALSLAIEIAVAATLIFYIRATMRRMAAGASLLRS
jgi:hypothetical protein